MAWTSYKTFEITGSTEGGQADYIIDLVVYYSSGSDSGASVYLNSACSADFSDVRFKNSDGSTFLNFWMYEKVDSNYCKCKIKIPTIPVSPGTVSVRIYYTNQESGSDFKIGVFTCPHYNALADRSYMERTQALQRTGDFVSRMSVFDPNVCGMLGDLIDVITNGSSNGEAYLSSLVSSFDDLGATPRFYCVGNHDFDHNTLAEIRAVLDDDFSDFEAGVLYGSFDVGDYHLVILDHNYDVSENHSDNTGDSVVVNSYIDSSQLTWLENDLAATSKKTIVCCHLALGNTREDHWPSPSVAHEVTNKTEVQDILEASNKVVLVICGHLHWTSYHEVNGIPYIHVPSLTDNTAIMRETSNANWDGSWAELTINDFRKEIKCDIYENDSVSSGSVVGTHYMYYEFSDDYGKASNPHTTLSWGYLQDYNESGCNTGEGANWFRSDNYLTRNFLLTNTTTSELAAFNEKSGALHFSTYTENDVDEGRCGWWLPSQTGKFYCHFEVYPKQNNKRFLIYFNDVGPAGSSLPSASYTSAYLIFDSDGYIDYYDGAEHQLVTYAANTWTKIDIYFDIPSHLYDIYVNGNLEISSVAFWNTAEDVVDFIGVKRYAGSSGWPVEFFIDNLYLTPIADSEPSITSWGAEVVNLDVKTDKWGELWLTVKTDQWNQPISSPSSSPSTSPSASPSSSPSSSPSTSPSASPSDSPSASPSDSPSASPSSSPSTSPSASPSTSPSASPSSSPSTSPSGEDLIVKEIITLNSAITLTATENSAVLTEITLTATENSAVLTEITLRSPISG